MTALIVIAATDEASDPIDARVGDRVLDLCDEHAAPVLFSCRSATCGTCRVRVLAGAEHLTRADADESEVLHGLAADPDERLACRLMVAGNGPVIRLRAIQSKPSAEG